MKSWLSFLWTTLVLVSFATRPILTRYDKSPTNWRLAIVYSSLKFRLLFFYQTRLWWIWRGYQLKKCMSSKTKIDKSIGLSLFWNFQVLFFRVKCNINSSTIYLILKYFWYSSNFMSGNLFFYFVNKRWKKWTFLNRFSSFGLREDLNRNGLWIQRSNNFHYYWSTLIYNRSKEIVR